MLHNSEPEGSFLSSTKITTKNVVIFVLGIGFEPMEPFRATVLQTVAIVHSAIPAESL